VAFRAAGGAEKLYTSRMLTFLLSTALGSEVAYAVPMKAVETYERLLARAWELEVFDHPAVRTAHARLAVLDPAHHPPSYERLRQPRFVSGSVGDPHEDVRPHPGYEMEP
jgi:hypothetical protein